MNNILVPVDKFNVLDAKGILRKHLTEAAYVGKGTYREIETAKLTLAKAKGVFETLEVLGLLSFEEKRNSIGDINRINEKLAVTQREKEAEAYARHMQRRS